MLTRINAERAAVGAAPFRLCATLMTAAQRHSEDQAAHSTMSHTGSNGSTMVQRAEAAGYVGWTSIAENVAAGYPSVTVGDGRLDGLVGPPGQPVVDVHTQHVGVGRAASGSGAHLLDPGLRSPRQLLRRRPRSTSPGSAQPPELRTWSTRSLIRFLKASQAEATAADGSAAFSCSSTWSTWARRSSADCFVASEMS